MKPPYLKKLSKKQLKKEYTRQWREAIRANGEIYHGNLINDQLHEVIRQQEHEINIKSIALTEHFWVIDWYKKNISQISNWVVTDLWYKEWELILINQSFNDRRNKEFEEMERENYRLKEELADTQEALSRSRKLRTSLQELADRKHWEKAKIEDMAQNLFYMIQSEMTRVFTDHTDFDLEAWQLKWEDLSEQQKDFHRTHATHIISHLPTDEKRKTTTEGSPE